MILIHGNFHPGLWMKRFFSGISCVGQNEEGIDGFTMTTIASPITKDVSTQREDEARLKYFYNGNILTMNRNQPKARHMLVANDRLLYIGNDRAPLGLDYQDSDFESRVAGSDASVEFIDLKGKTVLPGLTDAHAHFLWWGQTLTEAELYASTSEDHALQLLVDHQKSSGASSGWIRGRGWSQNLWTDTAFPNCKKLDELFPDRPVVLGSKCGHVAWVNSAALREAGITDSTPDPEGGEIERVNGVATGILKETAIDLVEDRIGPLTIEQRWQALERAQEYAHSLGITCMQTPEYMDAWKFLQVAHANHKLTMRVQFWMPVSHLDAMLASGISHDLGDDQLCISAVKVFADGSLGGRTAQMVEPYENEPDNYGIEVHTAEFMLEKTLLANAAGLSMAIHAIGDKAIENVVAAYEAAAEKFGTDGTTETNPVLRNRVEHFQVYHPSHVERFRKLKPIASIQPIHLCADMGPADRFWGARSAYTYAIKSIKEMGCPIVFGSDAPVEPISPFYGLYAATTRCNLEGKPTGGWQPQECIGLQDALEAYTINCAHAAGKQRSLGSLETGKYADFIILEEDPFEQSPEALRDTRPLATYSGGKCVYASEESRYN